MNIKNRVIFVFKNKISWLPFALAFIGLVVPIQQANATPTPGLNVTVYNNYGYNGSPPLPTVSGRPVQCTITHLVIDQNFGSNICGLYDDFIVKYEGYITSPTTQIITFYSSADDGTKLYIDGNLIDNNWFDKSGGGNLSTPVSFTAGVPKTITLWYYDNGGWAWVNLAWNQSGSYQTVPENAFTQNNETFYTTTTTSTTTIPPTTTTTSTTTTSSSSTTTTTESPTTTSTTTSSTISPSTIASTTTTEFSTTTSSFTTILYIETTTTTTDLQPTTTTSTTTTTTTTQVPVVPSATLIPSQTTNVTTPSEQPVAVTIPETTTPLPAEQTTTTELQTPTTLPTELPTMTSVETTSTTYPFVTLPDQSEDSLPETKQPKSQQPQTPDTLQIKEQEEKQSLITTISPNIKNEQILETFKNIENATADEIVKAVDSVLDNTLSTKELTAVFDIIFEENLSDKKTIELAQDILKGELDSEEFGVVIEAIFDEIVTDKVLIETFIAVLDTELNKEKFETIVNILESEVISNKQVAEVVTLIIEQEGDIDAGQATELATSSKVLESIDGSQATEIFSAVSVSEISLEDGKAIVDAVQESSEEVKEAFEEEINVFEGVFDDYIAIGSSIDTSSRRSLIAASAAIASIAANIAVAGGSPAGGSGSPQSGPSGGGGVSDANRDYRKEEEESEMSGEIAGGDDDDSDYAKNSIYKYYIKEDLEMKKFNFIGFIKKLWDITAGLAFTIAGSVVVYYTLSGSTQAIALFSTITACLIHYIHQIFKNDID